MDYGSVEVFVLMKKEKRYKLDPDNARKHEQRDSAAVKSSLEQFKAGRSIVVDNEDFVVAGNSTYEEARKLGIPMMEIETEGEVLVVIKRKDLKPGDPERSGLALADNRTTEMSSWNNEKATALLKRISDGQGFDFKPFDFSIPAFKFREPIEEEDVVDPSDTLLKKWKVKRGQVWEIPGKAGVHRVMCGDSTDGGDVALLLDGAEPYLMVTDPPYGVEYDPNWRNEAAAKGLIGYAARRVGEVANGDRADWGEVYSLWPCKVLYAWSAAGDKLVESGGSIIAAGFSIRSQIIWRKAAFVISRGHYHGRHEPCWYAVRKGNKAQWIGDHSQSTVWDIKLVDDDRGDKGHGTQKPIECMARPICNHEGNVADPFLGSGTTVVAAEQEGRICYGMELEPKYVAVTLERILKIGLKPKIAEKKAK